MLGTHRHSLGNLFVDDTVYLDTLLCLSLQDSVQTPFRIGRRGSTKVQLWCEPPILHDTNSLINAPETDKTTYKNEDGFTCALQHLRKRIHVIMTVNVPNNNKV